MVNLTGNPGVSTSSWDTIFFLENSIFDTISKYVWNFYNNMVIPKLPVKFMIMLFCYSISLWPMHQKVYFIIGDCQIFKFIVKNIIKYKHTSFSNKTSTNTTTTSCVITQQQPKSLSTRSQQYPVCCGTGKNYFSSIFFNMSVSCKSIFLFLLCNEFISWPIVLRWSICLFTFPKKFVGLITPWVKSARVYSSKSFCFHKRLHTTFHSMS